MRAAILSVGSELTSGQTVDTNSAWLARRLAELGIVAGLHVTVADEPEPLRDEILRAASSADLLLITGGLGPTADDLTRQAVAEALGVPLEPDARSLEQIRAFFTRRRREMPAANEVQALVPRGATPIENTCGTAPGLRARIGRAELFVMPGVPREMQVMYERDVLPALQPAAGGTAILHRVLYAYGAGESIIGERIADLMRRGRNPSVGTTAQQTIIGVRIMAQGPTRAAAANLLERDAEEVRGRLGPLIFGQDDPRLSAAVGALLKQRGLTIAAAESCTGGLIAQQLTDIPGSSAYLRESLVTYANESKSRLLGVPAALIETHGAVSAPVAEAMALGCRRGSGADIALSVTGIAGPEGGTAEKPVGLVFVGLADEGGCEVREYRLGDDLARSEVRERSAYAALDRVRRRLLDSSA